MKIQKGVIVQGAYLADVPLEALIVWCDSWMVDQFL